MAYEECCCDMEIKLLTFSFNFDDISSQITPHKTCLLNETELCIECFKEGFKRFLNDPSFINKFSFFPQLYCRRLKRQNLIPQQNLRLGMFQSNRSMNLKAMNMQLLSCPWTISKPLGRENMCNSSNSNIIEYRYVYLSQLPLSPLYNQCREKGTIRTLLFLSQSKHLKWERCLCHCRQKLGNKNNTEDDNSHF